MRTRRSRQANRTGRPYRPVSSPTPFVLLALAATLVGLAVPSFAAGAPSSCPNATIRAAQHSEHLPDCRAYEKITPSDKIGAEATYGVPLDADHVYFTMAGSSILPEDHVSSSITPYLASRTAEGWKLLPGMRALGTPFVDFSSDFSRQVLWGPGTLTPSEAFLGFDVFLRDGDDYTLLSEGSLGSGGSSGAFHAGNSADLSHVLFDTTTQLELPDDDSSAVTYQVYDYVDGQARVVGILPDETCAELALPSGCVHPGGAIAGDGNGPTTGGGRSSGGFADVISDDGSRIFFESPDPTPFFGSSPDTQLYVRIDGTTTVQVSASRCARALPDPPCDDSGHQTTFQGAADDGSRVLFSTAAQLTDDDVDANTDLYLYEIATDSLVRLTEFEDASECNGASGADIGFCGVAAVSSDARRVYIAAQAAMETGPGAPSNPNVANFYLLDLGSHEVEFVATMPARVNMSIGQGYRLVPEAVSTTPDGSTLVFESDRQLTAFDNAGTTQIYHYDAITNGLACVSCNSAGSVPRADPTGESGRFALRRPYRAVFSLGLSGSYGERIAPMVSADGDTIVFESYDRLDPRDSNNASDVYAWHQGELSLITSGTAEADAYVQGISPDGKAIFFATPDRLVSGDVDSRNDEYVALVNGGTVEPVPDAPPCAEDACQGDPRSQPDAPAAGSVALTGSRNIAGGRRGYRVRISRIKAVAGPVAALKVKVPARGRLALSGPGLKSVTKNVSRAGTLVVRVVLSERSRRMLRRDRRLRTRVRVTFRSEGAPAATAKTSLTFKVRATRKGR